MRKASELLIGLTSVAIAIVLIILALRGGWYLLFLLPAAFALLFGASGIGIFLESRNKWRAGDK